MSRKKGQVGQYRKSNKNKETKKNKNNAINNNNKLIKNTSEDLVDEEINPDMTLSQYLNKEDYSVAPTLDAKARRIAIAFIFESLGAPEDSTENPWLEGGGPNSISSQVKLILKPAIKLNT